MSNTAVDVFELPARWRAEIIKDFRLRGEERCVAASPGSGFPQLLDTTLVALGQAPPSPWVDLGGGLGGVGSWLQRRTHRSVFLVDPAEGFAAFGQPAVRRVGTRYERDQHHIADAMTEGHLIAGAVTFSRR